MAISKPIATLVLAGMVLAGTGVHAMGQARPAQKTRPSVPQQDQAADELKEAEDLLQKQHYQPAEEKLQALVLRQNSNPQVWFDLGFAQSRLGKTADSVVAYKKAAELSPKWFEAQQNLGLALAKSGDFSSATAVLKIAVTLKPTTGGQPALSRAWLSLAQVTEASHPQDAVAAYQKAVELDPTNSEAALGMSAQLQLGKLLAAQGKSQDAIAALEPVYASSPDSKLARELAALYLEAKQYDAAARFLQDLTAQNPSEARLHLDYGTALVHQYKYPEAQQELLKAVQLQPNLVEAYFDLGYAAQQNKNYELTLRALDARARLQPETPATYFLRATAYDSLRAYKLAAENYKLFLAAASGKFPDQEFQARHRLKAIQPN